MATKPGRMAPEKFPQNVANQNPENYTSENIAPKTRQTINNMQSNSSGGFVESTRRWLHSQKKRRQKEALERAVEEQRRILIEEQNKNKNQDAFPLGNTSEGDLKHNATFQSLTNQKKSSISHNIVGGLCGTLSGDEEDDDEEYVSGSPSNSDAEFNGDCDEKRQDIQSVNTPNRNNDDMLSFEKIKSSHTHTGGLTVHLEYRQNHTKRPARDLVKVFEEKNCSVPLILSLEQMTDIADNGLPTSIKFTKWKRLYSLQRDGDSFNSCFLRKVQNQTKTLLVVQSTDHEVMGAWVNSPWECQGGSSGAQFYGSAQACLWKVQKETGEVFTYSWTGKNRYIQVCDVQHKLIALGGGGEEGAFGLCVEDDFRVGSTGHCETFDNAPLCTKDQFEIMNVECWGFVSGFC